MRWSWWVVKKHVHTCMFAMWAPIHISNSHNTQGRKVLKWIFSLLQNQNQHLNYTIKVAQSFCFYIYRELFFLIMKFKLWWFGEKKSNHNLFSGVHEWIVCIAKHLSFVICCAHTYKKKNTRLRIWISWFYSLYSLRICRISIQMMLMMQCTILFIILRYFGLECCSTGVI